MISSHGTGLTTYDGCASWASWSRPRGRHHERATTCLLIRKQSWPPPCDDSPDWA